MHDNPEEKANPDWLINLPIRSEEIGFAPDEMKPCPKCGKANAPNRSGCLYCGTEFEGAVGGKLDVRELEGWEKGINVVVVRSIEDPTKAASELARMLSADPDAMRTILKVEGPVPIARVETEAQAASITGLLEGFGIQSRIVSDEKLRVDTFPRRLRGIEFADEKLRLGLFNSEDFHVLKTTELSLIVVATVREERTESMEKRKRKTTKTVSETQTASSEPVIDLYSKGDAIGWRIPVAGFDFSCLGSDKTLIATQNMKTLGKKFAEVAPSAKFVDDYDAVAALLEYCWPSEARKNSLGLVRSGFARQDFGSVVTVDNMSQVTRYSRLQWHLL